MLFGNNSNTPEGRLFEEHQKIMDEYSARQERERFKEEIIQEVFRRLSLSTDT